MAVNRNIYLLVKYIEHPKDPARTKEPGYMKDPANVRFDEQVKIVVGIKDKELLQHNVILNLTESKIVRNSFEAKQDYDTLYNYYLQHYESYITQSLKQITEAAIS